MAILQEMETAATLNETNPASIVYLKDLAVVVQDLKLKHAALKKRLQTVKSTSFLEFILYETIIQAFLFFIFLSFLVALVNAMNTSSSDRKHLGLQDEVLKPVFMSYAPAYEQDFTPGKMLHPNKEHVRQRELRNQVKREKRGVEREMRREAEVISSVCDDDDDDDNDDDNNYYHDNDNNNNV